MKQVSVKLSRPWMTDAGLRRPMEGPISVSVAEAKKIEGEKAGEIVDEPKPETKPKPKTETKPNEGGAASGATGGQGGNQSGSHAS